jgi:hypothetical protein
MANPIILTAGTFTIGTAWTGTAPGKPGTQTVAGTIASGTDISSFVNSVELPMSVDVKDVTTLGFGGYKGSAPGLKTAQVRLSMYQDFSASALHATLWPLFGGFAYIDIRAQSGARSATNPSFVFSVIVADYTPVTAKVGELIAPTVTWPVDGKFDVLTS